MTESLLRLAKDEIRDRVNDLDVHDAIALLEHLPRLVQWFRARRYDRAKIRADVDRLLGDLGDAAQSARDELAARFPDEGAPTDRLQQGNVPTEPR